MAHEIHIIPITSIGEISGGNNLAETIKKSFVQEHVPLTKGDVVVVTQKVVSKAEGRTIRLDAIKPSAFAIAIANQYKKDARHIEMILRESKRIVRMDKGIIICETHQGFVCANAGIDASNIDGYQSISLLPLDPDTSAKKLQVAFIKDMHQRDTPIAVIISDTWGRPWREGQVNVAIGSAGIETIIDYRGEVDTSGMILQASMVAIADEIASAAELVMNKRDNVPVALIHGYRFIPSAKTARSLLRTPEIDLFR